MRKRYTPAQKAAIVLELLREEDTRYTLDPGAFPNGRFWNNQVTCIHYNW